MTFDPSTWSHEDIAAAAFAAFVAHRFLISVAHLTKCGGYDGSESLEVDMQVDHRLHPKPSLKELQVGGNPDLDSFKTQGISIHAGDPRILEKSTIFRSVASLYLVFSSSLYTQFSIGIVLFIRKY